MKRLVLRWIILSISVVVASLLTSLFHLDFRVQMASAQDILKLFLGVALLALINATLGKILKLLTLPLNCLTLGLFSLVINALMLMLVASLKVGFTIGGSPIKKFITAFVGSLLISFASSILGTFIPDKDSDE